MAAMIRPTTAIIMLPNLTVIRYFISGKHKARTP